MGTRFLAVADIHSRTGTLRVIRVETARHAPDAVIVAGDLTNYGDAAEVRPVLEGIPGRVLAIPGNLDLWPAFDAGIARSHAESLVGTRIEIGGVSSPAFPTRFPRAMSWWSTSRRRASWMTPEAGDTSASRPTWRRSAGCSPKSCSAVTATNRPG